MLENKSGNKIGEQKTFRFPIIMIATRTKTTKNVTNAFIETFYNIN